MRGEDLSCADRQDEDEQFVLFKCAGYMRGLLSVRPVYDKETIGFLLWLLKANIQPLLDYMAEHVNSKKEDTPNKAEINICNLAPDYAVDYVKDLMIAMERSAMPEMTLLLKNLLSRHEESLSSHGATRIGKKISILKKMFKLTEPEVEFVIFNALLILRQEAEKYFADHLRLNHLAAGEHLSKMLEIKNVDLARIPESILFRIKLFEIDLGKFKMSADLINFLLKRSNRALFDGFYKRLTLKSIPLAMHMTEQDETSHILNLLKKKPSTSTHILIYGPPGTGKTSYAQGLIKELKLAGYEIPKNDNKDESQVRRTAIMACYSIMKDRDNAVIVVDEADNLLNTDRSWRSWEETADKKGLNQILAMKGIRMIWIANSIEELGNDMKDQFTYSIHYRPFSSRQRVRLWESILKVNKMEDLFGPREVVDLAKKYAVNPGVIDSAIQKTLETYPPAERDRYKPSIIRSLEAHLTLAHNGKRIGMKDKIEDQYSLDSLNIQGNLTDMMAQLAKFDRFLRQRDKSRPMNMNLLFHGSPGTGKSELAKYIAEQLDRHLLCKRASDIIDCWVGSTERNINAMFQEAEAEDAVLVIDEIDTFIFSRHNSIRSYETRATNEFLTQMESFNGILIGTTNNLTALDSASLRRFLYKIEFRYLTQEGCMFFYEKFLSPLTDERIPETIKSTLATMNNLTPGDFKVVRDKHSFLERGKVTHNFLIEALEAESVTKPNHRNIGF